MTSNTVQTVSTHGAPNRRCEIFRGTFLTVSACCHPILGYIALYRDDILTGCLEFDFRQGQDIFSPLHIAQTGSGAHAVSSPNGSLASIFRSKDTST
jgi:hypothetical protein